MKRQHLRHRLFGRPTWFGLFASLVGTITLGAAWMATSRADDTSDPVVTVEEKWSLIINEPAAAIDSPQLNTVMSPGSGSVYGLFTINYRDYLGFIPGGVGVELWDGGSQLTTKSQHASYLNTNNETITWTQVLELNGSDLKFKVVDGNSSSWGAFGGESLQVSRGTELHSLDAYDPAFSAGNAVITFGGNRVQSLTLVEVRKTCSSGAVSVDSTARVVFTGDSAEQ